MCHSNTCINVMSPVSIGNWEESDIVPNGVKPGQDARRVVVGERLVVEDPEAKLLRIRDEVVQVVMESLLCTVLLNIQRLTICCITF